MKHWAILAILAPVILGLPACSGTPVDQSVPTGVAVTSLTKGRMSGARAYYAVHAPLMVALDVIIDYDRYADFRPRVTESRSIAASQSGGQAFLRFNGIYADDVNATCNYTITEADGVFRMEYEMKDPSFAMWAHFGSFTLTPAKGGEWTIIDQEVLISTLAFNREETLAAIREDAEAFQRRIEGAAEVR